MIGTSYVYLQGCFDRIKELIKSNSVVVIATSLTIMIIEVSWFINLWEIRYRILLKMKLCITRYNIIELYFYSGGIKYFFDLFLRSVLIYIIMCSCYNYCREWCLFLKHFGIWYVIKCKMVYKVMLMFGVFFIKILGIVFSIILFRQMSSECSNMIW